MANLDSLDLTWTPESTNGKPFFHDSQPLSIVFTCNNRQTTKQLQQVCISHLFSIPKDPWSNRIYALARVSCDGGCLHRAPSNLLNDWDLALQAIGSSEGALSSVIKYMCFFICFLMFSMYSLNMSCMFSVSCHLFADLLKTHSC